MFTLSPHSVLLIGNFTLALSGVSCPCSPKLCLSSGILYGIKTWDLQRVGEGVTGWMSTVFSDGTSFLLACMAPSEHEASSGFQITFGVLRYFTNLPIALPAYSCHHFFPQFLLTHKYSVWNPGWEAPLLSEAIAAPPPHPPSVENSKVTSFSGEGTGKAFLSAVLILHFVAKSCCLYGVLSSSGNYGYLLFCILSQDSPKTVSKRVVLIKCQGIDIK